MRRWAGRWSEHPGGDDVELSIAPATGSGTGGPRCVAPVLLGDGVRLFDHPGGTDVRLERLGLTGAPSATNLWLRAVR
jgi:hypothetical protein